MWSCTHWSKVFTIANRIISSLHKSALFPVSNLVTPSSTYSQSFIPFSDILWNIWFCISIYIWRTLFRGKFQDIYLLLLANSLDPLWGLASLRDFLFDCFYCLFMYLVWMVYITMIYLISLASLSLTTLATTSAISSGERCACVLEYHLRKQDGKIIAFQELYLHIII